jgi:hypothetical protein
MTKNTVIDFAKPSDFSPDPLTDLLRAGAQELLATAVRAEVSEFMAGHVHLLDDEGRQRLVRHGFLPEREVLTIARQAIAKQSAERGDWQGSGSGASGARPWDKRGWFEGPFQLLTCSAISAQVQICGGTAAVALPQGDLHG